MRRQRQDSFLEQVFEPSAAHVWRGEQMTSLSIPYPKGRSFSKDILENTDSMTHTEMPHILASTGLTARVAREGSENSCGKENLKCQVSQTHLTKAPL